MIDTKTNDVTFANKEIDSIVYEGKEHRGEMLTEVKEKFQSYLICE